MDMADPKERHSHSGQPTMYTFLPFTMVRNGLKLFRAIPANIKQNMLVANREAALVHEMLFGRPTNDKTPIGILGKSPIQASTFPFDSRRRRKALKSIMG